MRRGLRTTLAVLLGLAPACVGTSTGNPTKPPSNPDGVGMEGTTDNQCDSDVTKLAGLDAQSPLGFSAAQMLELAADSGEIELQWSSRSGIDFGPESNRGTLEIEITPRNSEPRFVDRREKTRSGEVPTIGTADIDLAYACPDSLELDVSVHVKTGGGALHERFDAKLTANNARVARVYQQIKAADLQGSFTAKLDRPADAVLDTLNFDLQFSEFGPAGSLGLGFEVTPEQSGTHPDATSRGAISSPAVATWPAGLDCSESRFGVKIDREVGGFSVKSAIERFNAANLQLTAAGSTATALSASFVATAASACVVDLDDPSAAGPSLEVPGTLAIRSADGRIDGRWSGSLRAQVAPGGGLSEVRVSHDLRGSIVSTLVEASQFEATYGIRGVDVSGYDQAGIFYSLVVSTDGAIEGELTVNGATQPNCPAPAPQPEPTPDEDRPSGGASSPGCAGIQIVPVWKGIVGAGQ